MRPLLYIADKQTSGIITHLEKILGRIWVRSRVHLIPVCHVNTPPKYDNQRPYRIDRAHRLPYAQLQVAHDLQPLL